MEFFMIVNMNNIGNTKNEKDIHAMDIVKNEIEHLTKEIKVEKEIINIDFNDNGEIKNMNKLETNEKIEKIKLQEDGTYNSPKYS